jgi:signal transduction histidine kinase
MERFMSDMASGNLSGRLILRKGDELLELADGINRLSQSMKTTMINEREGLNRLEKELENLKTMAVSKHPDISAINNLVSRMDSEIISLRKEIDRFKV